jgi:hypothetical protein
MTAELFLPRSMQLARSNSMVVNDRNFYVVQMPIISNRQFAGKFAETCRRMLGSSQALSLICVARASSSAVQKAPAAEGWQCHTLCFFCWKDRRAMCRFF